MTAVNDIEWAAANFAHAAFRISTALGSSTGAGAGSAWTDALAGLEALGAVCGVWALAGAVRSTLNATSNTRPVDLYRIVATNDDDRNRSAFLAAIMGSCRIQTFCWRSAPLLCR